MFSLSQKTKVFLSVLLSIITGSIIWYSFGSTKGMEFFTGYVLELSLSVDNLFVMSMIFASLGVPKELRDRVLFWGILGAIVFRAIFISLGTTIVSSFSWILIVFGVFLLYSGLKSLLSHKDDSSETEQVNPKETLAYKIVSKLIPITDKFDGNKFFTKENGILVATPLFLALVMVEFADIVFAVDSIPAIFAVTTDPMIVFTSNICAILGLRSMYFVLEGMLYKFEKLGTAVNCVLVYIGLKILGFSVFHYHIDTGVSLGIVVGILLGGILWSLKVSKKG
jgi:tellurite resistance protein TerC